MVKIEKMKNEELVDIARKNKFFPFPFLTSAITAATTTPAAAAAFRIPHLQKD